ncbi:MAG: TonB-dependent receptor [Nitrospira sp.]|jgi:iron complex outermembrane receptor protein|nr:TonB-dependent receptor [Nitrospira sp.]MBP6605730.1 TonB-dependent receptor [Nitrospira sp.]MCI1277701.1 TonB-dependent receptor [Nitrospira sp.]HQY56335.1 TonB-dependent receptor [Nitrospira sp.]HRA95932.1 TonB-dependent receptor [Nitrospira sp.]
MKSELNTSWYPLLAAGFTLLLSSLAAAEPAAVIARESFPFAANDELALLKEEETVSIASRYEQPISQAPSNVYVITDEDIRQSGAIDLPTVLRRVPGLEIMQTAGADFNVSARGGNQPFANKMLVMVDGRSIYLDVQGTVFWKSIPVTLPEIKRIEVLKGPASAVYGFNAFDGVINIITKSPEEMKGTTLQFGAGELGTISSAAVQAGTVGKFGYRLSIGRDQTQQWRDREALGFRSHKFNVQTEYALSSTSKLQVSGGLVDTNRHDGQVGEVTSNSIRPSLAYANVLYEHGAFLVRAWWSGYTDHATINPNSQLVNLLSITDRNGQSTNPFSGNTYNVDVQHAADLWATNRLLYGINYRHNSLSSSAIAQFSREDRLGLFIQDEWRATSAVTIVAGLRYDLHSQINGTWSPRVALLYQPVEGHTFHLSGSTAYRPPTLFESYQDQRVTTSIPTGVPFPPSISSTVPVTGSTRLTPEQIISYEAGYQGWYWKHRLRVRADLFFNHVSDLIGSRIIAGGASEFVNDQGAADIYGGEAGIEFLASRWLSGFANYAYEEIGQSFSGTVKRGAPRSKVSAGLRTEWENGLSGEIGYYYVGATTYPLAQTFTLLANIPATGVTVPSDRIGSYNLLNLRVGYRFWQQKAAAGYMREAEVAFSIFNALNDRHREHPLGDRIGSRSMGWITVRF